MVSKISDGNIVASTQFLQAENEKYAYRRFGKASAYPLLFLQHFMGTLDNWDPAVTDALQKAGKLFSSITQGWDDLPVRCPRQSPAWQSTLNPS